MVDDGGNWNAMRDKSRQHKDEARVQRPLALAPRPGCSSNLAHHPLLNPQHPSSFLIIPHHPFLVFVMMYASSPPVWITQVGARLLADGAEATLTRLAATLDAAPPPLLTRLGDWLTALHWKLLMRLGPKNWGYLMFVADR